MIAATSNEQQQPKAHHYYDDIDEIKALFCRESSYLLVTKAHVYEASLQLVHYRSKILVWVDKTVRQFLYDTQLVTITMDYFDRYVLQTQNIICPWTLQLVAMSSLYLAMKLHMGDNHYIDNDGKMQPKRIVSSTSYAELSSGKFSSDALTAMEIYICHTLEWKMNPVTSTTFVDSLLQLMTPPLLVGNRRNNILPSNEATTIMNTPDEYQKLILSRQVLLKLAKYFNQVVMSLPENSPYFNFVDSSGSLDCDTFAPSTVAYASILLSMEALTHAALPLIIRNEFLHRCLQLHTDLHPHRTDVHELQHKILKKQFQPSIFLKQFTTTENIAMQKFGILEPTFLEGIIATSSTMDSSPLSPRSIMKAADTSTNTNA